MNWLSLILISIAGFGTSNALVRYFSTRVSPIVGTVLLIAGMSLTALVIILVNVIIGGKTPIPDRYTIAAAILAGVISTAAQIVYSSTLAKGLPLSIAIPLLVGGLGVAGVIAGVAVFHESLSIMKLIGVSVILVGTIILAR